MSPLLLIFSFRFLFLIFLCSACESSIKTFPCVFIYLTSFLLKLSFLFLSDLLISAYQVFFCSHQYFLVHSKVEVCISLWYFYLVLFSMLFTYYLCYFWVEIIGWRFKRTLLFSSSHKDYNFIQLFPILM